MSLCIAFDIGTHHFAHSIVRIHENKKEWSVVYMQCHDFIKNQNANKFVFCQKFWETFHSYIKSLHSRIKLCNVILIEKQMGFGNRINYKAIQLGSQLMAHFILHFPEKTIIEYPSTQKTKIFKQTITSWTKRKEWAVDFVTEQLESQGDEISLEWLKQYKKKDDICDTILMILAYNIEKKKYFHG